MSEKKITYSHIYVIALILVDLVCFQFSLISGYLLWVRLPWHGNWQYFADYAGILYMLPPIALLVFSVIGLYKPGMGVMSVREQALIFKGIWIIYSALFAITFFIREIEYSRLATLYSMIISTVLISSARFFIRHICLHLNEKGVGVRNALIYGAGFNGQRLVRWIQQSPRLGVKVAGFVDDDIENLKKVADDYPILGGADRFEQLVDDMNIDVVFVANRAVSEDDALEIIQKCKRLKVQCWFIPQLFNFYIERLEFANMGGVPLVGVKTSFVQTSYGFFKGILDSIIAAIALVVVSPIMLTVALGVYFDMGKPIFFHQKRVGKDGKHFTIYKFRSLSNKQGHQGMAPELSKGQSNVTEFGKFIRKTGLDELPQLWNVLKGEMSLIGPRPEMPLLVEKYNTFERERLAVRPGITGLWQVSHDRKRLMIHENMDYDLYYAEHMSFNLDLAIIVKTVVYMLKRFIVKESKDEN